MPDVMRVDPEWDGKEFLKLFLEVIISVVLAWIFIKVRWEEYKKGKLIRQERYSGSMQRSFYVGENITEEDIKASFKHGVLNLTLPKKEKEKLPEKKQILIEGWKYSSKDDVKMGLQISAGPSFILLTLS